MEESDFSIHQQLAVMQRAYDLLKSGAFTWTAKGYALTNHDQERITPGSDEVVKGSLHALLCKAACQTGHSQRIVLELNQYFSQAGFASIRQVDQTIQDNAELIKVLEHTIPLNC